MLTIQRDGKVERWINYIAGPDNGLTFPEGSDVRHDVVFEPMALVSGQTEPLAQISYRNPRSLYSNWRQQADAQGRFEVPVPTGEVKLDVNGQVYDLKDLKAHESRALAATPAALKADIGPVTER